MDDSRLLAIAIEMRAAQRAYYAGGRTKEQLARARAWEERFDRAVAGRLNPTLSLFGLENGAEPHG